MHRGQRFGTRGTSTTYPPCKLTAILCSLQYLRAWDASAVVFGRSTTDPSPRYLVIVIIYRKVNNQAGVRESKEIGTCTPTSTRRNGRICRRVGEEERVARRRQTISIIRMKQNGGGEERGDEKTIPRYHVI